jgi:hypothetical protein
MDANRILKYSRRRCRSSVAIASVSFRNFFFVAKVEIEKAESL